MSVCLSVCISVLQPVGSCSSPGSRSILAPDDHVKCNATFPYLMTKERQSHPIKESIKEDGLCACFVHHLLISDMIRPRDANYYLVAPSFKDVNYILQ